LIIKLRKNILIYSINTVDNMELTQEMIDDIEKDRNIWEESDEE
jgi:hypothetical protein